MRIHIYVHSNQGIASLLALLRLALYSIFVMFSSADVAWIVGHGHGHAWDICLLVQKHVACFEKKGGTTRYIIGMLDLRNGLSDKSEN